MRLAALRGIYILTVADIGWASGWYIRPLFAGLAVGAVLAWGVTAAYYFVKAQFDRQATVRVLSDRFGQGITPADEIRRLEREGEWT